jgi:acyl-CoA thioesterase-2
VLGQALTAAYATVDGRVVHSLHAYFLRRGDFNMPIVYQVDRSRDGGSFSSRRVIAIQNGEQIFTFAASFQAPEDGIDHQIDMPKVPPPESLPDAHQPPADILARLPDKLRSFLLRERPCRKSISSPRSRPRRCSRSGSARSAACQTMTASTVAC